MLSVVFGYGNFAGEEEVQPIVVIDDIIHHYSKDRYRTSRLLKGIHWEKNINWSHDRREAMIWFDAQIKALNNKEHESQLEEVKAIKKRRGR